MSWRAGLTIVLLLAAIASGWSVWHQSGGNAETMAAVRSEYVLHDYELVSLDSQGKESFTLRGPRLQRDPGAKSMTLDTPKFLVPDRNGAYWDVKAQLGRVPDDGQQLQLRGQVVATSPTQVPPPTRIETEELNIFPNENRATSAAIVTLTRPGLTMRGRGLQADFDRQVSLLSDVRYHYVPTNR
ncbi:LPS export ABC transporter periplasmic protein LptC [Thermomonas sp. HDW16]|uniref:LPS export ABC transporter periplasmic protein LptC n=1 Tax=Thermomonas sp. HDW16 TaxID=2714945 RepID=UPI00140C8781|nr:LPS export ABC transporter periplasmic protein LptC [Thermomonas sp. HDW16]QIL20031.1 LPS export ABC transporter periplasmic protein LptC [Thermomonas sp. HDW16]